MDKSIEFTTKWTFGNVEVTLKTPSTLPPVDPNYMWLQAAIATLYNTGRVGKISDSYHTYDELYHHRAILFAALCTIYPELAWKSLQHDDPLFHMYDGMFICGIETPEGQATYHFDVDPYWDMFNVKELPRAPKYDGHSPGDAINRIKSMFCL